jgi:hypothetical protein
MLNVTLGFNDLQGTLYPSEFSGPQLQSSPNIKNNTHSSPGPGGPFSVWLRPGASWYSPGNAFRLTLQASDGNLVLQVVDDSQGPPAGVPFIGGGSPIDPNSINWIPVWSAKTNGKGVTEVDFQIDGNLVAYAGSKAVFSTNTNGNEKASLIVQDDGNLVIYNTGRKAVFATNTSAVETPGRNA